MKKLKSFFSRAWAFVNEPLEPDDGYWRVRQAAIMHPKATAKHISQALKDNDKPVRQAAIEHPNATAEHIGQALNDKEIAVRTAAQRIFSKRK